MDHDIPQPVPPKVEFFKVDGTTETAVVTYALMMGPFAETHYVRMVIKKLRQPHVVPGEPCKQIQFAPRIEFSNEALAEIAANDLDFRQIMPIRDAFNYFFDFLGKDEWKKEFSKQ